MQVSQGMLKGELGLFLTTVYHNVGKGYLISKM